MSELVDFVKRYPHGSDAAIIDDPVLKQEPLRRFIPQHFHYALQVEGLLMLAKDCGYSDDEIAQLRHRLEPLLEPVMVSLDALYGREE